MKNLLLSKIRLSQYFVFLFVVFVALVFIVPSIKFQAGALTLFSVNSFLYGFYIAPILAAQRGRIEELHRIVRAEANAIFAMVLSVKKLPKHLRNDVQAMFIEYLQASIDKKKADAGEIQYEQMITYCLDYRGVHHEEIDKLLEKLVANQQNRTNLAMQLSNRVYSNEWMVIILLFAVTLSFVLLMDAGGYVYQGLAALLATGLSMLLVILLKMSTLTHKKARMIWDPYKKLIDSHFYRID